MQPSKLFNCLAAAVLILCCAAGFSQTITGAVNGTVTDPSGAVIPGAKVTATALETGINTSTTTNAEGVYSIRFLTIGQYQVTVEAAGFNAQKLGPFSLESGQVAKFDAKLVVAGSTQSVSVSEALAPLLNTENAELGTTLDNNAIEDIPLQGRNFQELALYTPGAISTNPTSFNGADAGERTTIGGSSLSVNGNRAQANNYLLNGIEINETINNLVGYNPAPNALEQVRVISANAPAEWGNVNGGAIVALLNNGTNQFHGSLYYFGHDAIFNANSWTNNRSGIARHSATTSQFGATLGGPIFRDKLFFFGDYEGYRYHTAGDSPLSVVTAKMRQGDFSELLDPTLMCRASDRSNGTCYNKNLIQLYDSQNNYAPYAGNLNVPINNPAAVYLYAHPELYPLPNHAPNDGSPTAGNYHGPSTTKQYNDQFDVRIDYKASDKNSFFGSYSQSDAGDSTTTPLAITFPTPNTYPSKLFTFNFIRTFSPAVVNEFRAGFFRVAWNQGAPKDTTGVFGMSGNALLGIQGGNQAPGFSAQEFGLTNPGNRGIYSDNIDNNYTYGDNLTWVKGLHLFKFGAELIRYQQNIIYSGVAGAGGYISYSGIFSGNPLAKTGTNFPNNKGYGVADFNTDRAIGMGRGPVAGYVGQRQWRDALFAQDDWKIRRNLTINLGLRWEWDQPIYEVNNKQSNVNLQTGELEIAGQNGNSRALYDATWANFMPRVGFSYNPTQRIVVRAGFGSTTYLEGTGANLRPIFNPPFQTTVEFTGAAPVNAVNTGEYVTAESAFSAHSPECDTLNDPSCAITIRAWTKNLRPSTINEFSLTTEYQVSNTASFQVGYVGETGVHLINANNGNQLSQPCWNGTTLLNYNSAACFAQNKAPYYKLAGQSGFVRVTESEAMMNYNALQTTYRQRSLHGLQFTANYTYSKSMTNSTGYYGGELDVVGNSSYPSDPKHLDWEYGPAPTDATHNVNFNLIYQLPFGRGRMFGSNVGRFMDEIIGGWKASMTGSAYTGIPMTIVSGTNTSGVRSAQQRALRYRHFTIRHRSIDHWFGDDPSTQGCTTAGVDNGVCAYGAAAVGIIPNARPRSERVPGYQSYNAALFKEFAITERQHFSLRAEAFNALNVVSYGNPVQNISSSNFGQISSTRSSARNFQFSAKYSF